MTSSSSDRSLLELDLYRLLDPTASLTSASPHTDIARHYRKQARLLHPDKNPNNPKAAEQFDTLQRAYELLSDDTKRAEYDGKRRLVEEKRRKEAAEDVRVRVMRERLEEREKAGKAGWEVNKRQMQAVRIHRENEAVIQQLRQTTQPPHRREEKKQAEGKVEEREYGDRGDKSVEADGFGTTAGLDMATYETNTLARMREMARRKKEEREQQRRQQPNDTSAATHSHSTSQRDSEVIVLDDESGAVT